MHVLSRLAFSLPQLLPPRLELLLQGGVDGPRGLDHVGEFLLNKLQLLLQTGNDGALVNLLQLQLA